VNPGRERAGVAALVLATLLWGGTFVAIRDTVRTLSPQALVCARFAAAAIVFAFVALLRRRAPGAADLRVGLVSGALMVGGFTLQAIGLTSTSAGTSAFLTLAGTLAAGLYAWPLLGQRPSPSLFAGLALALAGAALLSLDRALQLGRGELLTLAGATLFAFQVVWLARDDGPVDAISVAGVQAATVAVLLAPFAGDVPRALAGLGADDRWRFAYLAIAGSTVAPLLQVVAQRRLPAGRVGLLFALEPVFALLFAVTLGAERFAPRWWAGSALILTAVVLVEWRAATRAPSPASP
jgi:drug/metabolite transporter (DMT)-like permease